VPYLQGYLTVEGTDAEDPLTGERIMPDWTKDKIIRVCLQFQDQNATTETGFWESYRWNLNYTFPNGYTNFTM